MKLSRGIQNFWIQLGNTLLTPAFITIVCMLWLGWQAILGGLLLSLMLVFLYLKRKPTLIAMTEATLFELKPKSEWLGAYATVKRRSRDR